MWETAIHQVKCTHVKHEKNINESRRENVQNERKLRREKQRWQHKTFALYSRTQCIRTQDLYDLDNVQNKVFLSDTSDVFILYLQNDIFYCVHHQESQQFPRRNICRKTYRFRWKTDRFFLFCFLYSGKIYPVKKSSVDFYSVFPFWNI